MSLDDPKRKLFITTENISQPNQVVTDPLESKTKTKNSLRSNKYSCCNFSSRQLIILVLIAFSTVTMSVASSLFPPFYPQVAEEKGASASVYGFVLGSNCLVMFLVTPFIGNHLKVLGLKFVFTSGMFCSGVCFILTGFLDRVPAGANFIAFSIGIRIMNAIGNSGVITAQFAMMAIEFPNSMIKIVGMTRLLLNIGQLAGPALGGALHQIGGFKMPFVVLGIFQVTIAFISLIINSSYEGESISVVHQIFISNELKEGREMTRELSVFRILKMPSMWISLSSFIVTTITNGFLSVCLEPQVLRQFNLSPLYMGILYGVKDGANSLCSAAWVWACDRKNFIKMCLIASSVITCVSFAIMGPFPFLPIPPVLWLMIFGLVLNGIGTSGQQVSAVLDSMQEVLDAGYPDDPNTHGCIAGLWSSFGGLGRFLSRSGSGIIVDHIGFQDAASIVLGINAVLTTHNPNGIWIFLSFILNVVDTVLITVYAYETWALVTLLYLCLQSQCTDRHKLYHVLTINSTPCSTTSITQAVLNSSELQRSQTICSTS